MKILVMSDSHGDYRNVKTAVLVQSKAEVIIHCGDGEEQAEMIRHDFPEKAVYSVRGNCDWGSSLPTEEILNLEGKRIMFTHGHLYQVKWGYDEIKRSAREKGVDILLFGHTHIPYNVYEDGMYVMNPGSIHGYMGSYGIIDIVDKGIITNIVRLR